jgi:hypothetical protein
LILNFSEHDEKKKLNLQSGKKPKVAINLYFLKTYHEKKEKTRKMKKESLKYFLH